MKGMHINMVKIHKRNSNVVIKLLSNELKGYDDDTIVFISRVTISTEIVKLQNQISDSEINQRKLVSLIKTFHSQAQKNISLRRFMQMNVKMINECFEDTIIPVYIDE